MGTLLQKQLGMEYLSTCHANTVTSRMNNSNIPLPVQSHETPITWTFSPPSHVTQSMSKRVNSPPVYKPTFYHQNIAPNSVQLTSAELRSCSSERLNLLREAEYENQLSSRPPSLSSCPPDLNSRPPSLGKLKEQVNELNHKELIQAYVYENDKKF